MEMSENCNEVIKALAEFQKKAKQPKKSGINKHTKSRYSTLVDILERIKEVAPDCGLAVTSFVTGHGQETSMICTTKLLHTSGQWIQDSIPLIINQRGMNDMQLVGSAITYARRYSLQNLFGLVGDPDLDDDGASIISKEKQQQQSRQNFNPELVEVNQKISSLMNIIGSTLSKDDLEFFKKQKLDGKGAADIMKLSIEEKKKVIIVLEEKKKEILND
jgi:hypothetical protein